MAPTPASSLEVEDALVKAADRLGMRVLLLRLVAGELPDDPWLVDLEVDEREDATVAVTTHLCGTRCGADATSCLTAFKVEDALSKRQGRVVAIHSIERAGHERVRVTLRPIS